MRRLVKIIKLSVLVTFVPTALYFALSLFVMWKAEVTGFYSGYFAGRLDEYLRQNGIETDAPDIIGSYCANLNEKNPAMDCTVFNSYSKNSLIGWDYLIYGDWDFISDETVFIWTDSQASKNETLMKMLFDFQRIFCVQNFEHAPLKEKSLMCRNGKVRIYLVEFDPNMEVVSSGYLDLKRGN